MRSRCHNPNTKSYKDYGARGIQVLEPWRSSFEAFAADVLPGYSDGMTLERRDSSGPYCKDNCRWATRLEQANNTRPNVRIEFRGENHTMAEWGRILGISNKVISARLKSGWSVEKSLSQPVNNTRSGPFSVPFIE